MMPCTHGTALEIAICLVLHVTWRFLTGTRRRGGRRFVSPECPSQRSIPSKDLPTFASCQTCIGIRIFSQPPEAAFRPSPTVMKQRAYQIRLEHLTHTAAKPRDQAMGHNVKACGSVYYGFPEAAPSLRRRLLKYLSDVRATSMRETSKASKHIAANENTRLGISLCWKNKSDLLDLPLLPIVLAILRGTLRRLVDHNLAPLKQSRVQARASINIARRAGSHTSSTQKGGRRCWSGHQGGS